MNKKRPHLIIIGGGFGGLYAARKLRKAAIDITLIDKRNHHVFQPLLYQVATAAMNAGDIAYPIRKVLRRCKNTQVLLGEVTSINITEKYVKLKNGHLQYDYLIVASGATH